MKSDLPVQYQKGWVEFYKLRFKVTPDTLIPRPETELLVDEALSFLATSYQLPTTILDLGTGAGCIAISIAKNTPENIKIIATDISEKALDVARENAKTHGVEDRIEFIQSDLLSNVTPLGCNILVTNLPYIPTSRITYLDSSVKDYEPHLALDGGEDGFELYRKLFRQISQQPPGLQPKLIIGEIDYTHGELALSEAQKFFPKANCQIKLDLHHRQRILIIKFTD